MDLTHIDNQGNAAMVDVGNKDITRRRAVATGKIHMSQLCFNDVKEDNISKGNVLTVAKVSGIMAAKQTGKLIPLCHPLVLDKIEIVFKLNSEEYTISAECTIQCQGRTGVEMEALTGVSVALLTIYDMCKAVDRNMLITDIHLLEKSGGKSGTFFYEEKEEI